MLSLLGGFIRVGAAEAGRALLPPICLEDDDLVMVEAVVADERLICVIDVATEGFYPEYVFR